MSRIIKAESIDRKKEFHLEDDCYRNRKIVIFKGEEIGYFYNISGKVEAYDGVILSESTVHPMKACRLLKEYWMENSIKREGQQQQKTESADKMWLEEPLIKIMVNDYKAKNNDFNIVDFKKWYRRKLDDYEEMYPDLA